MLGHHKAISIPQSTPYAAEMRKWEASESKFGKGERPYVFQEFPKMVYKADYAVGKGIHVSETHIVNNADEERNLLSRGFYAKQEAAFEAVQREQQTDHGRAAAEREALIQKGRYSENVVREIRAAESDHGTRHLPDVPETPIKRRRGRPAKVKPESVPA